MNEKILIADDDMMLRRLLSDMLKKQNYEVVLAEDGEQAIKLFFETDNITLCIIDVMMPVYDGYDVVKAIREHSEVPIIMLTALGDVENELKGFRFGVDDYISKPFSYEIILARVENLIKKCGTITDTTLKFGDFTLDQKAHRVFINNDEILLNPKEYALFNLFATYLGQVFSREQLLAKIWGYDYEGEIRTVDTHIKMLRKKLGSYGDHIFTVRGTGYRMQVD